MDSQKPDDASAPAFNRTKWNWNDEASWGSRKKSVLLIVLNGIEMNLGITNSMLDVNLLIVLNGIEIRIAENAARISSLLIVLNGIEMKKKNNKTNNKNLF